MSIKISTISLGAYGITTVIPQPPTKCSIHSGYCHTCIYLHFYATPTLGFFTNPCIQRSEIHLPFACPSLGFQQRM